MKRIKLYKTFVNEKIEYNSSIINGVKYFSKFAGSTNSENEFIKIIKNLPETVKSIEIPTSTLSFNSGNQKFNSPINTGDKTKLIKLIKDMTKAFAADKNPIITYSLKSYYGVLPEKEFFDSFYIQFKTDKGTRFNNDMSNKKYGSLD